MLDDPKMAMLLGEIKGLAESFNIELCGQLDHLRDGLGQAQGLVRDAIAKIDNSLRGLNQQAQKECAGSISLAIRALQVEDMVKQILEDNQKRLSSIENCTAAFASGLGSLCTDQAALAEQLDIVHQQMSSMFQKMRLDNHKPVRQRSMDAGDIELF